MERRRFNSGFCHLQTLIDHFQSLNHDPIWCWQSKQFKHQGKILPTEAKLVLFAVYQRSASNNQLMQWLVLRGFDDVLDKSDDNGRLRLSRCQKGLAKQIRRRMLHLQNRMLGNPRLKTKLTCYGRNICGAGQGRAPGHLFTIRCGNTTSSSFGLDI